MTTQSPIARAALVIINLAWDASGDEAATAAFIASREWTLFLLDAESAGYPFGDLAYEIDPHGTSVKNEAEQAAQFAHSVLDNEVAPDTVAAREKDAADEAARAAAKVAAQLTGTAAGRRYVATVAGWRAAGLEVTEEITPATGHFGERRTASVYAARHYGSAGSHHAYLSITLRVAGGLNKRTSVRTFAQTHETSLRGQAKWQDAAIWLRTLVESKAEEAKREAAVVAPEPEEPEEPEALDTVGFIIAAEEGTLTHDQFEASAQRFVDSGVWRALQGSWLRTVLGWADAGLVSL